MIWILIVCWPEEPKKISQWVEANREENVLDRLTLKIKVEQTSSPTMPV